MKVSTKMLAKITPNVSIDYVLNLCGETMR
jgi:hypothetical protein